ncbi:MAG: flagellar hook-length control protein FliK [Deltaproteobacteria bacterium]|nr:flagellar hook-length control protein FliK [Deltaproteobacteria bacterium]
MADGVLFGEGSDGATEIRVELSDEFLGGAEVRVSIRAGVVSATFVAADLESHRLLLEQSERLAKALLAKGLRVDRVSVERPGSR